MTYTTTQKKEFLTFNLNCLSKEKQITQDLVKLLEPMKDKKLDKRILTKIKEHLTELGITSIYFDKEQNSIGFYNVTIYYNVNGKTFHDWTRLKISRIRKHINNTTNDYVSDFIDNLKIYHNEYSENNIKKLQDNIINFDLIQQKHNTLTKELKELEETMYYTAKETITDKNYQIQRDFFEYSN